MELQLRKLRRAHGLTQGELAEKIGVTLRVVSSWEREETQIPLTDAARIADVFDCTLDELAGRKWTGAGYADPGQAMVDALYRSMDARGRAMLMEQAEFLSARHPLNQEVDGTVA